MQPQPDSAAPADARGTTIETEAPHSLFPGDPLAVYALAALREYPAARERVRELGIASLLFDDDAPAALALEAMTGESIPLTPWAARDAARWLDAAEWFRPSDEKWALYCVDRLTQERATAFLPVVLRWAGDMIEEGSQKRDERGWKSVSELRRIVADAFALAEGKAA